MENRSHDDARFRLFFERSSDAILLLDTSTNDFVQYNAATLEMLRCTREELAALHPSVLSPPVQPDGQDSFSKANEMIATAIREGSHRFEWVHCSPHRPEFPVEVLLTPVTEGSTPLLIVVWRDITERKRIEEAQRKTQKLESLGLLAGGIAHDFNNLLTAIIGNLVLARVELAPDSGALKYLEHLEAAAQRAAHLTRQMLAYSGQGTFTVAPMDLGQEVRAMAELLAASVPKGVRLVYELQAGLPPINADAAQIEQVIMNLVINAAESIEQGVGTITLRTQLVDLSDEQIRQGLEGQQLRPGSHVLLKVEDTGSGMPPEVAASIFDPFFSTKKSGRGLGLSALLGIVKAHKGGILLESAVGRGTTFNIYFPAAPARPEVAASPSLPLPLQGGTVLLVEDEEMIRRTTKGLLELLGFTVLEASDGDEAIAVYRAHHSVVRWVLMDLTMPGMDGHTAFIALREIDPSVKVVLTSGWAADELAQRFREHPPAGFLSKPFLLPDVLATLHRAGVLTKS